jgi:hypothetical protein
MLRHSVSCNSSEDMHFCRPHPSHSSFFKRNFIYKLPSRKGKHKAYDVNVTNILARSHYGHDGIGYTADITTG